MKRKANATRKKISKKKPANQKSIDEFILDKKAKTEIKINKRINIIDEQLQEIPEESNENKDTPTKQKKNLNENKNNFQLNNGKILLMKNKKKLIENLKNQNLSLFQNEIKEKEMTFPIIIKTKLIVNPEFKPNELLEILNKIKPENNSNNWIELLPFIDNNKNIIQLKKKVPYNSNNYFIINFFYYKT